MIKRMLRVTMRKSISSLENEWVFELFIQLLLHTWLLSNRETSHINLKQKMG